MNIFATNAQIRALKEFGYCCVDNVGHTALDPENGENLTIAEDSGDKITTKVVALQNFEKDYYEVILTIRF